MFCAHNFAGFFGAVPTHNIVAKQTDDWFRFLDSHKDWVSAPAGILWPKRMLLFWSPPPITHTFSDQGEMGRETTHTDNLVFAFIKQQNSFFQINKTPLAVSRISPPVKECCLFKGQMRAAYTNTGGDCEPKSKLQYRPYYELLYLHVHIMCSCSRADIPILPIVEIVETQTWELGWAAVQVCPLVSTITLTNTPPPPDGSPINTEEKLACVNKDCFL